LTAALAAIPHIENCSLIEYPSFAGDSVVAPATAAHNVRSMPFMILFSPFCNYDINFKDFCTSDISNFAVILLIKVIILYHKGAVDDSIEQILFLLLTL